jgi:beta-lactamase superfamily II metal-dependent hydrolase
MPQGWIRAYAEERAQFGITGHRNERAQFRAGFHTSFRATADPNGVVLAQLAWGDAVELPQGLSSDPMTAAVVGGQPGFVASAHVVEIAYVARRGTTDSRLRAKLTYPSGGKTVTQYLLWGDCVQLVSRGATESEVRARGFFGTMRNADLTPDPLLEVYFIDVGQGDGVLVRTPDLRHMLVDGGLERSRQLTGKNAADFVDWKFFTDYGDHRVRLDGMVATHSDVDHYGGLHDLVRKTAAAHRELDCGGVDVGVLYHPGLSRWENRAGTQPPHADGLGPRSAAGFFVRLLGDRADVESALVNGAADELSGPWKSFFRDVLANSADTGVVRAGVSRAVVAAGGPLPELWPAGGGCTIRLLAPVTEVQNGAPALVDLGPRSINTNGHSVCLRLEYGKARILLTADLNKASMDHLRACYGDLMGVFECDVAKACHHGSHDVSYRFLEAMHPAATVISSGDNEGYAHPRPEIVGASAVTGFVSISRDDDRLLTPLLYMTEIERSVALGAVERIDFANLPVDAGNASGIIPGRQLDELSSAKRFSPTEQKVIDAAPAAEQPALEDALKDRLDQLEQAATAHGFRATYYYTVPNGPTAAEHLERGVWRSRVMHKNHYGLVNVRTDGELIMCATLNETDANWIIHAFPARFGA